VTLLDWILTGVLIIGFLSGALFMVIYTRRWNWWKDEHGAHLGFFTLSLTLIMGLYILRPFIERELFAYIRAPFFVAVIACMVWRLILLFKSDSNRRRIRPVEGPCDENA
jgi:hypothetical protein